jgi:hypothetical protein
VCDAFRRRGIGAGRENQLVAVRFHSFRCSDPVR